METMIKRLVADNPYRILGVYVGESLAKEIGNKGRISAYSKVGQTAVFELKGDEKLGLLSRNEDMAEKAAQELSLPAGRVRFSLFWYADEKYSWASVLNGAIDSLIAGNLAAAFEYYELLLLDDSLRDDFVHTVTSGLFPVEKEGLSNAIVDNVSEYMETHEIFSRCGNRSRYFNGVLFERKAAGELGRLMETFITSHPDFYVLKDSLESTVDRLMPYAEFAAAAFEKTDYRYKECTELIARSVYRQGTAVLSGIANWLCVGRTLMSVKLCRSLMEDVFDFVNGSVRRLDLADDSCRILWTSVNEFEQKHSQLDHASCCMLKNSKHWYLAKEIIKVVLWLVMVAFISYALFS